MDNQEAMNRAFGYIERNRQRFLAELKEFLSFPSVSADSDRTDDVKECAIWLAGHLGSLGLESRVVETSGHPIVLAHNRNRTGKRVIVYGHYDVQPPDPVEEWKTPPFEPVVKDGFIYGRGASDDKGQLFAHVKAVEALIKAGGGLYRDVIFLFEGEEESGGRSLEQYIARNRDSLACDFVVVSDTAMYDEKTPAIAYGLRGIVAFEFELKTAEADLHSGVFGGAVPNAAMAICRILAECKGPGGEVLVDGFYNDVRPLTEWETRNLRNLAVDADKFAREAGVINAFGQEGFSILERIWARPALDINGVWGGYTGEGSKTVIPASASAKVSIRLVPDQKPEKIAALVTDYIRRMCPKYAELKFAGPAIAAEPIVFDVNYPAIQAGRRALERGFGAEPVFTRCGGSIPVVNTLYGRLGRPVVLMGFGLDSDGAHSPNERFSLDNFYKGIKASVCLLGG